MSAIVRLLLLSLALAASALAQSETPAASEPPTVHLRLTGEWTVINGKDIPADSAITIRFSVLSHRLMA